MMGKTYTAANGQVVTDEMIDAWCESYERGEFPDGEHTVGGIVHGRPPLSGEGTATLSVNQDSSGNEGGHSSTGGCRGDDAK